MSCIARRRRRLRVCCTDICHSTLNPTLGLIVVLAVQDSEDGEEEVENVKVKADACGNLLFDVIMSHDQLSVDEDIATEDQGRNHAIYQLDSLAAGEESRHETKDDQNPQGAKQIGHPVCEIIFGLAGKQGQTDEDAEGENQGLNDDSTLVEGGHDRNAICLETREPGQEQHVGRIGLAFPECEEHEANGSEERQPHHPCVGLDPVAISRGEEG